MPERPHRGATAGEDTTPVAPAAVHRAVHTPPTGADRPLDTNLARFAGSAPGRRNRPSEAVRPLLYSRLRAVPHARIGSPPNRSTPTSRTEEAFPRARARRPPTRR